MHNHFYILDRCYHCGKLRGEGMNVKAAIGQVRDLYLTHDTINAYGLIKVLEALDTCDKPEECQNTGNPGKTGHKIEDGKGECKHDDAIGNGDTGEVWCPSCNKNLKSDSPELKPGYVPEESLESKLFRVNAGRPLMYAQIAEEHFAQIIEAARKEGFQNGTTAAMILPTPSTCNECHWKGHKAAIAEMNATFDRTWACMKSGAYTPNEFYNIFHDKLFGPEPKAHGG